MIKNTKLFSKISLQNSSREVCCLYPEVLQYLMYNMPPHESQKWRLASLDNVKLGKAAVNLATNGHYGVAQALKNISKFPD